MKCKHKNASFGHSHTDYLGWCPDCRGEVSNKVMKRIEKSKEDMQDKTKREASKEG